MTRQGHSRGHKDVNHSWGPIETFITFYNPHFLN